MRGYVGRASQFGQDHSIVCNRFDFRENYFFAVVVWVKVVFRKTVVVD